jgi:hypothetical protein
MSSGEDGAAISRLAKVLILKVPCRGFELVEGNLRMKRFPPGRYYWGGNDKQPIGRKARFTSAETPIVSNVLIVSRADHIKMAV